MPMKVSGKSNGRGRRARLTGGGVLALVEVDMVENR
jgi:hypothetical protein